MLICCFFFQAEDGIRDLVRSRGLGDVYKRQERAGHHQLRHCRENRLLEPYAAVARYAAGGEQDHRPCLLYTSDAADERSSVDLGGRRIIKKKRSTRETWNTHTNRRIDSTV